MVITGLMVFSNAEFSACSQLITHYYEISNLQLNMLYYSVNL